MVTDWPLQRGWTRMNDLRDNLKETLNRSGSLADRHQPVSGRHAVMIDRKERTEEAGAYVEPGHNDKNSAQSDITVSPVQISRICPRTHRSWAQDTKTSLRDSHRKSEE